MTNESKPKKFTHMPGPYFYEHDRDGVDDVWRIVVQSNQRTIAQIHYWDEPDTDEAAQTEANARLLAAAPDMFEALTEMIAALNRLNLTVDDGAVYRAFRSARHAVAFADGTLSYRAC
jgi:hypothetical protein